VDAQHLAYEYAKRGARLALAGRREKSLQEVADRAREYGSPDVLVIPADVSKVEDCKRIVGQTMDHFGRCKCKKWYFCCIDRSNDVMNIYVATNFK